MRCVAIEEPNLLPESPSEVAAGDSNLSNVMGGKQQLALASEHVGLTDFSLTDRFHLVSPRVASVVSVACMLEICFAQICCGRTSGETREVES